MTATPAPLAVGNLVRYIAPEPTGHITRGTPCKVCGFANDGRVRISAKGGAPKYVPPGYLEFVSAIAPTFVDDTPSEAAPAPTPQPRPATPKPAPAQQPRPKTPTPATRSQRIDVTPLLRAMCCGLGTWQMVCLCGAIQAVADGDMDRARDMVRAALAECEVVS